MDVNNFADKITELRNKYFTEDRIYFFEKLMKDPVEYRIHERLTCYTVEKLYKKALNVLSQLNSSHSDYEEVEELEYEFTHYLAAISELVKIEERKLNR